MATSLLTRPATLRTETVGLVALAERDLAALWRLVAQGADAGTALHDLLPAIIETYGAAGAAMAADWYDDQRDAVGAAGRFYAIPADISDRGAHALVGWALSTATDDASLATLVAGGTQRRIADHVRNTVTRSAVADKAAEGWQRVARADGCLFCRMLAGRGGVYRTESTADFAGHDDCYCSATVAWRGQPVPVRPYKVSARRTLDPDTGKPVVDPDFLRAKAWIADHL